MSQRHKNQKLLKCQEEKKEEEEIHFMIKTRFQKLSQCHKNQKKIKIDSNCKLEYLRWDIAKKNKKKNPMDPISQFLAS